jgi:LPS-assembly protein
MFYSPSTLPHLRLRPHVLSLIVPVVFSLTAPAALQAQVMMCPGDSPGATRAVPRNPASLRAAAQLPINLQADSWDATVNGEINLVGKVQAIQGERTLSADALHYNTISKNIVAEGTVQYEDSTLLLSGSDANMSSTGGAAMAQASFMLKASSGRGTAAKIQLSPEGNVALDTVRYTTCPPGSADWELKLSDLDINQQSHIGTGRNVRLEFQGVPIFYTPWISFPVGNQRKSGFLFPTLGGSSRGGNALSVPWYWNLAANYDDTITPTYDTSRGFKLDNEFRYLGESSKGKLVTGYMPHDNKTQQWRGIVELTYRNDFTDALRLDVNAGEVRDNEWFEDFSQTRDATSTVYLTRRLSLSTHSTQWHGELNLQNLQVIDTTIDRADRPYTVLPQLMIDGYQHLPFGGEFALDSELSYFTRGVVDKTTNLDSLTGARLHLVPQLSLPLRTQGMYVIPSAAWHYTGYQLQNTLAGAPNHPSISAPAYSLDTGLVFERLSGSKRQRLYTLEPRLLYSYVPYRAQNDVPVFDTDMPDFSLVQLFRSNRFLGPDRLGDTNQLSAGVTTRMLDSRDGREFLSGTLGQAFYFRTPCVTSLTATTCGSGTPNQGSSDLIGQVSLSAYKHWTASAGLQWDPSLSRSERGDLSFQYRPGPDRTLNLGYSYDRDTLRQWVTSFAWPISRAWSGYGRVVYSQLDRKFLDHFAGLEYRSCCWNIRAVIGRAVTTRTGAFDTQYRIQLELKGLSSVGTADTFLESSIPGYSARRKEQ